METACTCDTCLRQLEAGYFTPTWTGEIHDGSYWDITLDDLPDDTTTGYVRGR